MASITSPSWSEIVSTSTRVSGAIAVIWRVASTPRDPRHVEIHDDDVGRELADETDGLGPGGRLADDAHVLLLEQRAEPRAEEIVVVDEQHADVVERPTFDLLYRLRHVSTLPSPLGSEFIRVSDTRQRMTIATVRRPQARACACDGNQRSILFPRTLEPTSAATASP